VCVEELKLSNEEVIRKGTFRSYTWKKKWEMNMLYDDYFKNNLAVC